jgi:protein SCO1/2
MKAPIWFGLLALLLALAAGGCGGGERATSAQEYEVRGKVVSVSPEKKTVRLDHEEIPGLMKAMTMNFRLESPEAAKDLSPGDRVHGRLRAQPGVGYVITRLEKIAEEKAEK